MKYLISVCLLLSSTFSLASDDDCNLAVGLLAMAKSKDIVTHLHHEELENKIPRPSEKEFIEARFKYPTSFCSHPNMQEVKRSLIDKKAKCLQKDHSDMLEPFDANSTTEALNSFVENISDNLGNEKVCADQRSKLKEDLRVKAKQIGDSIEYDCENILAQLQNFVENNKKAISKCSESCEIVEADGLCPNSKKRKDLAKKKDSFPKKRKPKMKEIYIDLGNNSVNR